MNIVADSLGYMRQDPLPSQAELDEFYADTYYQDSHADQLAKEGREWWYWGKEYQQRLDMFKMLDVPAGELLDYGAGFGWFAKAAAENRWRIRVCEQSVPAIRHLWAEGYLMAFDLDYPLWEGCFAGIHCSLVLEHVRDPFATLQMLVADLQPRGVLCVVVPNEYNPLQVKLIQKYGYTPHNPEHLNYFTQISIQLLMEQAGLDIVHIENTFPMEWFALHGLNYVRYPWMGPIAHWARMVYEVAIPNVVLFQQRHDWAEKRIGRETIVWGRK